jgi:hypothetical protein
MVHGPCGRYNGRCSKHYLKEFHETTTLDENGFAVYKWPDNKRFVIKGGVRLDNWW